MRVKKLFGLKVLVKIGNKTLFKENSLVGITLIGLRRNESYEKIYEKNFETNKNETEVKEFIKELSQFDENTIIILITQGNKNNYIVI